jgi:hypothetical protein
MHSHLSRPVILVAATVSLVLAACGSEVVVGDFEDGAGGAGGSNPTRGAETGTGQGGAGVTSSSGQGATTGVVSSTGTGPGGGSSVSVGQGGEGSTGSTGVGGAGSTGVGGAPPSCGGLGGFQCEADEWCDYPDDAFCGGDDSTGVCLPRPQACTFEGPQVCACDGQVYTNACFAQMAGMDVSTPPQCGTPCGGESGQTCSGDEYCEFLGDSCGFNDEQGICVQRPPSDDDCPLKEVPVCACDGTEYPSACHAAFAGSDLWGGDDLCGGA